MSRVEVSATVGRQFVRASSENGKSLQVDLAMQGYSISALISRADLRDLRAALKVAEDTFPVEPGEVRS